MNENKRLKDILNALQSIERYRVATFEEFLTDIKTQDAILYNLIIIGEAANQISDQFREQHPSIPWSSIIGTRNVIVHGYDQVKLQIVWEILQRDLANLNSQIANTLMKIS